MTAWTSMIPLPLLMCVFVSPMLHQQAYARERSHRTKLCNNSDAFPNYDESFFNIFKLPRQKAALVSSHVKLPNEKTIRIGSKSECRFADPKKGRRQHYSVMNYDPNRIPSIVFEAQCCYKYLANVYICEPVYYYRQVLQKDRTRTCYHNILRAFSIGCFCNSAIMPTFSHELNERE